MPLKGKQKNLPEGLKAKILASDGASMEKNPGKGKVKQAVENFKTRNDLTSYTKGDPDRPTVVVTTKKKVRKIEKKAAKAEEKTANSKPANSKSAKVKSVKYKKPKNAKYGVQKGKKGFQKTRKK